MDWWRSRTAQGPRRRPYGLSGPIARCLFLRRGQTGRLSDERLEWDGLMILAEGESGGELAEGFCDPIQLTSKSWDNAAFFCEFEAAVGNPVPDSVSIPTSQCGIPTTGTGRICPPGKSHCSAFRIRHSRRSLDPCGLHLRTLQHRSRRRWARLYLDGVPAGSIPARTQTFTWDPQAPASSLGVGFTWAYGMNWRCSTGRYPR